MPDGTRPPSRDGREAARGRARRRKIRRRLLLPALGLLLAACAVLAIALKPGTHPSAAPRLRATADHGGTCPDPSERGELHVSGNRVLDAAGKQFIYYGITVYGGLEDGGSDKTWMLGERSAEAQIKASRYWHANTVRLQVNEENLFKHGDPHDGINKRFLDAICHQVQLVRRQGMEAVINDQTEWPEWSELDPTARTVAFWKVMGIAFGNEPGVIFDLFNEPRLFYPKNPHSYRHRPKIDPRWVWRMWRDGGRADGRRFVGMQTLVNDVRRQTVDGQKVHNQIWIEGPYDDDVLGMAGEYPIHGTNLVWSLHHPPLNGAASWTREFGYLTRKYPMVDGEWGQYASNRPECRAQAYRMVPGYLRYLRAHGIGLLAWSLQPGALLADPSRTIPSNTSVPRATTDPRELRTPSVMHRDYACTNSKLGQGTGRLLLNYFRRYSRPAS